MPKTVKEIELPEGEYVLCDPCYVMRRDLYDRLEWFRADAPLRFSDGKCGLALEMDGRKGAAFLTMYGDGEYGGKFAGERESLSFGVDSGTIGAVPLEWTDRNPKESRSDGLRFNGPATLFLDDCGGIGLELADGRIFKIETANLHDVLREQYDLYRAYWLMDHVADEDFLAAVNEYAASSGCTDGNQSFVDWLEDDGFGGQIWADLAEARRSGELSWARREKPEIPYWMKMAVECAAAYDMPSHWIPDSFRMIADGMNALASEPEETARVLAPLRYRIRDGHILENGRELRNPAVVFDLDKRVLRGIGEYDEIRKLETKILQKGDSRLIATSLDSLGLSKGEQCVFLNYLSEKGADGKFLEKLAGGTDFQAAANGCIVNYIATHRENMERMEAPDKETPDSQPAPAM